MSILAAYPTGSRFICHPPVQTTDEDILLLVHNLQQTADELISAGYTQCLFNHENVEPGAGVTWTALRKGDVNFVLISDPVLYVRSVAATLLAQHLNITDKTDRVELFRSVKFGQPYSGQLPNYFASMPEDEAFDYRRVAELCGMSPDFVESMREPR